MATISGSITVKTNFVQVSATLPGAPAICVPLTARFGLIDNGTAPDQADQKYTRKLTLAATPTALDLTDLADTDGNPVSFARVRQISIIIVDTTDGHAVKLGYSATTSNAWTSLVSNPGQITIEPSTPSNSGGFFMMAPNTTGWPVSSANKLLNLDPGSNTVVVYVEIVGASV